MPGQFNFKAILMEHQFIHSTVMWSAYYMLGTLQGAEIYSCTQCRYKYRYKSS